MDVTLRKITRDNWRECVKLKVAKSQERFVASNAFTLAQACYETECVPLAVYDDNQLVGLVMYRPEDHGLAKIWFIDRVMIGEKFQNQGYGRATMKILLAHLQAQKGYNAILISFVPENSVAQKLYSSFGFKDTGEVDDGELVYRLGMMG